LLESNPASGQGLFAVRSTRALQETSADPIVADCLCQKRDQLFDETLELRRLKLALGLPRGD